MMAKMTGQEAVVELVNLEKAANMKYNVLLMQVVRAVVTHECSIKHWCVQNITRSADTVNKHVSKDALTHNNWFILIANVVLLVKVLLGDNLETEFALPIPFDCG